jgi:hypothetical protein
MQIGFSITIAKVIFKKQAFYGIVKYSISFVRLFKSRLRLNVLQNTNFRFLKKVSFHY